jgi:hypothetical protein
VRGFAIAKTKTDAPEKSGWRHILGSHYSRAERSQFVVPIMGAVGSSGKYLVTGMAVDTKAHIVEDNLRGTMRRPPISLCARARTPVSQREIPDYNYRGFAIHDQAH